MSYSNSDDDVVRKQPTHKHIQKQTKFSKHSVHEQQLFFSGEKITFFLDKYQTYYRQQQYSGEMLCNSLCLHMKESLWELIEELEEFQDQEWENLKEKMKEIFGDEDKDEYLLEDLDDFIRKQLKKDKIRNISELNKIYQTFTEISKKLVLSQTLPWQHESTLFSKLLPKSVLNYIDTQRKMEQYLLATSSSKGSRDRNPKCYILPIKDIKAQARQYFKDQILEENIQHVQRKEEYERKRKKPTLDLASLSDDSDSLSTNSNSSRSYSKDNSINLDDEPQRNSHGLKSSHNSAFDVAQIHVVTSFVDQQSLLSDFLQDSTLHQNGKTDIEKLEGEVAALKYYLSTFDSELSNTFRLNQEVDTIDTQQKQYLPSQFAPLAVEISPNPLDIQNQPTSSTGKFSPIPTQPLLQQFYSQDFDEELARQLHYAVRTQSEASVKLVPLASPSFPPKQELLLRENSFNPSSHNHLLISEPKATSHYLENAVVDNEYYKTQEEDKKISEMNGLLLEEKKSTHQEIIAGLYSTRRNSTMYAAPVLKLEVEISGVKILALLDTGSQINLLKDSLRLQLGLKIGTEGNEVMRGINGQTSRLVGTVEYQPILLQGRVIIQHLYSAPESSFDLILGIPFLSAINGQITFSTTTANLQIESDERKKIDIPLACFANDHYNLPSTLLAPKPFFSTSSDNTYNTENEINSRKFKSYKQISTHFPQKLNKKKKQKKFFVDEDYSEDEGDSTSTSSSSIFSN